MPKIDQTLRRHWSKPKTIVVNCKWNILVYVGFYRATLCVSAVFAVARCPSVRPSVRHVGALYPYGWRYRQTSYSAGSPIILVFYPSADTQFQGEPLQRERKIPGVGKFSIFDWNRRLSRKRNGDIFNDLHGPITRFSRSRHFWSRV